MEQLTQRDFDDLSAFLDGELEPARAAEVQRLIAADAAWASAYQKLAAMEGALDSLVASSKAPAPPADLADRIIRAAHRIRRPRRALPLVRWLVPAAAAAAVVLAAGLTWRYLKPAGGPPVVQAPPPVVADDGKQAPPAVARAEVDKLVRENLDFFQDYDVLSNYETLAAIETLESRGRIN